MSIPTGPFTLLGRRAGAHVKFKRLGRHVRKGTLHWTWTVFGRSLRRRKLLQMSFGSGEWRSLVRQAGRQQLEIKPSPVEATPHIAGKEARVHPTLLTSAERFMNAHAKSRVLSILSGYRSYAAQLALWLAYLAGTGNPANKPGTSKHEATGGYTEARAIDAYIGGVAFWTWVAQKGLRDEAESYGLTQPHRHEPWHVEHGSL